MARTNYKQRKCNPAIVKELLVLHQQGQELNSDQEAYLEEFAVHLDGDAYCILFDSSDEEEEEEPQSQEWKALPGADLKRPCFIVDLTSDFEQEETAYGLLGTLGVSRYNPIVVEEREGTKENPIVIE